MEGGALIAAIAQSFPTFAEPGANATTDIAVLRIDDAPSLEVGDPVLAIGAPYGLEQTLTREQRTILRDDNLVAAHLHASPTAVAGTNGAVVWGFFGSPLNDNNPNDVVFAPFASGVGGTVSGKWDLAEGNNTTLTAQLPNILGATSYINFHTTQFGAGEIRGLILVPIPEPETYALMLCGLAALVAVRRRRR